MNLHDLSPHSLPIVLKDAIDNNRGAVWDLVRKVPHYYYKDDSSPNWLNSFLFSTSSIYFLNPLNNHVMELSYVYNEWRIECNFTNSRSTKCIILVGSINEDCLVALLPYSGLGQEDITDLPF